MPRQDHVWITTAQLVRFYKDEFDKMLCKLDSAKYARAFQQKPTLLKSADKKNRGAICGKKLHINREIVVV